MQTYPRNVEKCSHCRSYSCDSPSIEGLQKVNTYYPLMKNYPNQNYYSTNQSTWQKNFYKDQLTQAYTFYQNLISKKDLEIHELRTQNQHLLNQINKFKKIGNIFRKQNTPSKISNQKHLKTQNKFINQNYQLQREFQLQIDQIKQEAQSSRKQLMVEHQLQEERLLKKIVQLQRKINDKGQRQSLEQPCFHRVEELQKQLIEKTQRLTQILTQLKQTNDSLEEHKKRIKYFQDQIDLQRQKYQKDIFKLKKSFEKQIDIIKAKNHTQMNSDRQIINNYISQNSLLREKINKAYQDLEYCRFQRNQYIQKAQKISKERNQYMAQLAKFQQMYKIRQNTKLQLLQNQIKKQYQTQIEDLINQLQKTKDQLKKYNHQNTQMKKSMILSSRIEKTQQQQQISQLKFKLQQQKVKGQKLRLDQMIRMKQFVDNKQNQFKKISQEKQMLIKQLQAQNQALLQQNHTIKISHQQEKQMLLTNIKTLQDNIIQIQSKNQKNQKKLYTQIEGYNREIRIEKQKINKDSIQKKQMQEKIYNQDTKIGQLTTQIRQKDQIIIIIKDELGSVNNEVQRIRQQLNIKAQYYQQELLKLKNISNENILSNLKFEYQEKFKRIQAEKDRIEEQYCREIRALNLSKQTLERDFQKSKNQTMLILLQKRERDAQLEAIISKNNSLEIKNKESQDALNQCQNKKKVAQRQLQFNQENYQKQIQKLQIKLKQHERETDNFKQKYNQIIKKIQKQQNQLKQQSQHYQQIQFNLKKIQKEYQQMMEFCQRQKYQINQKIKVLKTNYQNQMMEKQQKIRQLNQQIQNIKSQQHNFKRQSEKKYKKLQRQKNQQLDKIQQFQNQQKKKKEELIILNKQLKSKLDQYQLKLKQFQKSNNQYQNQIYQIKLLYQKHLENSRIREEQWQQEHQQLFLKIQISKTQKQKYDQMIKIFNEKIRKFQYEKKEIIDSYQLRQVKIRTEKKDKMDNYFNENNLLNKQILYLKKNLDQLKIKYQQLQKKYIKMKKLWDQFIGGVNQYNEEISRDTYNWNQIEYSVQGNQHEQEIVELSSVKKGTIFEDQNIKKSIIVEVDDQKNIIQNEGFSKIQQNEYEDELINQNEQYVHKEQIWEVKQQYEVKFVNEIEIKLRDCKQKQIRIQDQI